MKTKTANIFLSITLALCSVAALAACDTESELGHQHSYTKEVTAPTCIDQGYTTYTCSCGHSYDGDYVETDDSNHTYEWEAGSDAGCDATGIKGHYRCPSCYKNFDEDKKALSEEELIIPASHSYEWVKEKSATCNEVGTKAHYVCKKCEKLFDENKEEVSASDLVIQKAAHSYKNGECENCHAKKPSEGLAYTLVNSEYSVSIGTCTDTDIVIPAYYEGTAVIYVNDFSKSDITSVTIEEGVTFIWEEAFKDCAGLKSVTFPDSIKSISGNAFENCAELKEIELSKNLENIDSSAFKNCNALKSVVIPNSVTWLGESAFEDCGELKAVTLGSSLTTIGKKAFYNCVSLRKIEIPESVKELKDNAFENCTALTEVTINGAFEKFGDYAFKNCSRLKEVTIGEGATYIDSAFSGCNKLERVTLPASLKSLPEKAFNSGLKEIIYNGTVDQWAQITFGRYHDPLNYASVLYINGKPLTDVTFTTATKISAYAFEGCETLTSISIPENVTEIASNAFDNCPALKSITVAEGNTNYCSVDGILYNKQKTEIVHVPLAVEGKITIPNGITVIGYREFDGCKSLTNVIIPDSVTKIDRYAFSNCESLTSITIPDSVTSIGQAAFYGCSSLKEVKLPKNTTEISTYQMFAGCSSLQKIDIPNGITYIRDRAFDGCSSLISVTIPSSVTIINNGAFSGCVNVIEVFNQSDIDISNYISALYVYNGTGSTKIENVNDYLFITESGDNYLLRYVGDETELVLPSDYKGKSYKIYPYAFNNCDSLTSVTIPENVTEIGKGAFSGCKSLTSVTIPSGVKVIKDSTFADCSSLQKIDIPNGITYIGDYAFSGCSSLTNVTIPSGVTSIRESVFAGCSSLTSVTIPENVTEIGGNAFHYCTALTSVTLGKKVKVVGGNAFYGCSALKDVYYRGLIDNWVQIEFKNSDSNPISAASNFYIGDNRVTEAVINAEIISEYAFYSYMALTRVTLYNTVAIGGGAFWRCNKLVEVYDYTSYLNIQKGSSENGYVGCYAKYVYNGTENTKIEKVNDYLFITESGTNYLLGYLGDKTELVLPSDYKGKIYKIYPYAFNNCDSLTSVTIPEGITEIGKGAFSGCKSLTNVTIPSGVKVIKDSTFAGCTALTSMNFPQSIEVIGESAFYECKSLVNVTIPDTVTEIGENAFYYCNSLISIIIPDSVTKIGENAFYCCSGLREVTLGKKVEEVGENAFYCCPIANVYYGGTKAEWENTDVKSGNNNLIYAEIYYYSETIPDNSVDFIDHWHFENGVPAIWADTEE